jgi:hypothetical protein
MVVMTILISFSSSQADDYFVHSIITEPASVSFDGSSVAIDNGEMTAVPGAPEIGYRLVKLVLPANTSVAGLTAEVPDTVSLGSGQVDFARGDIKTGISYSTQVNSPDQSIYGNDDIYPETRVEILNSGYWGDIHLIDLAVYPVGYRPLSGKLMLFPEIKVTVDLEPRRSDNGLIARSDRNAHRALSNALDNQSDLPLSGSEPVDDPPNGNNPAPEYLVITSDSVAPGFEAFVEWKNQKGVPAEIVLIEDILATYPGIDRPEQLRNYLIDAYNDGASYVLLGGNEDNVPIRYLYPGNVNNGQPELSHQFISDLYFADLTGDWDVDGDGVWGESYNDDPDIYPELYVGRVPVWTAEHAAVWGEKAITYEKDPGNGDTSYLTKALVICADQMRDELQHETLAGMLPGNFEYDISRLIEEPSGHDPNPTQPLGETVVEVMQEGWGFISNLNHGDFSWYGSMSSGYGTGNWIGVWGDTALWEGCGSLRDLTTYKKPSIQYSTSCNLSALDFDKDIFFPGPYISPYCYGESAVLEAGAGVAFLGNSRHGWINSSFNVEKVFVECVFEDSTSRLSVAQALSKIAYPNHRDIAYGHNLLGDPEMVLWGSVNGKLLIEGDSEIVLNQEQQVQYKISVGDNPVQGAKVCVYMTDGIFATAITDASGSVTFNLNPQIEGNATVTATRIRHIPVQATLTVGAGTYVDGEIVLPKDAEVFQNYPNPFNSNTTIEFSLPERARVEIAVYDIGGRLVKRLASAEFPAGNNSITWNGSNESDNVVASGVYFFTFSSGNTETVRQMTLLK